MVDTSISVKLTCDVCLIEEYILIPHDITVWNAGKYKLVSDSFCLEFKSKLKWIIKEDRSARCWRCA